MSIDRKANLGLTTADALKKLHNDITRELEKFEKENKWRYQHKVDKNNRILSFYSIFITIFLSFGLIFTGFYFTAILVLLILIINVFFVYREDKLKYTEMIRKTREILDDIELAITLSKDWNESNYPHLVSPMSPCITLCWTYRDNEVKNLPTALLVEGDVIILRLGQTAPGNCYELSTKGSKPRHFIQGETYGYNSQYTDVPNKPMAVQPLPDLLCVLEHTPFIDQLRHSLSKFLDRPQTSHNHQRHVLINTYLQKYVFSIVLVIVTVTIILRSFDSYFIRGKLRHQKWEDWAKACILNWVSCLISLLPLIFPLLWINLHHWGSARLATLISIPQPLMRVENSKGSPDINTPTSGDLDLPLIPRQKVFCNYIKILMGSCELLSRSTNIIQVLGSVSAFCCVDKKGILSWPNPTPEKVFFLRDAADDTAQSENSLDSDLSEQEVKEVVAEVLDLTHDQNKNSPYNIEFDDHEWKSHLKSLKPLGLAILVNTCCEKTQMSYSKFCSHIAAASMVDKNLVPVTNRYDLCASFMHGYVYFTNDFISSLKNNYNSLKFVDLKVFGTINHYAFI